MRYVYEAYWHSALPRPYVAKIVGTCHKYRLDRQFLKGEWHSSRSGAHKGVKVEFEPRDGELYELRERVSHSGRDDRVVLLCHEGRLVPLFYLTEATIPVVEAYLRGELSQEELLARADYDGDIRKVLFELEEEPATP